MKTIRHDLAPTAHKACLVFAAWLLPNLLPALHAADNTLTPSEVGEGWKLIFNGKDLAEWNGAPEMWRVENGAIVSGTSSEKPMPYSTALFWKGHPVSDFELTYSVQISDEKNWAAFGVVFRNDPTGEKMFKPSRGYIALAGPNAPDWGRLTDITVGGDTDFKLKDRYKLGNKVTVKDAAEVDKPTLEIGISVGGSGNVMPSANYKAGEWNRFRLLAVGNRLRLFVNGIQTVEYVDERKARNSFGPLGLYIHSGSRRVAQFKDIKLKELGGSALQLFTQNTSPPTATGHGQLKVLSDQFLNAKDWVLARLDLAVPGTIADKVGALKATLAAESALNAQDKEAQDSYKLGIGLCDALSFTLKQREQAFQQAGGSAVRPPGAAGIQQWDRSTKVYGEQLGAAYAKLAAALTARSAKPFIVSANTPTIVFPPFAASPVVPPTSVPNPPSAPPPVTGNKPPPTTETPKPDEIVGRWRLGNSIIVLADDGTFENSAPNYHEKGRWRRVGNATPPRYEFNWSFGRKVEEYYLSGDELKRKTQKGWVPSGNRVK